MRRRLLHILCHNRGWYAVSALLCMVIAVANGWFGALFAAQQETGWEQMANLQTTVSFLGAAVLLYLTVDAVVRKDHFADYRYRYIVGFEVLLWVTLCSVLWGMPAYMYQLLR